jgi:hypothetical protein
MTIRNEPQTDPDYPVPMSFQDPSRHIAVKAKYHPATHQPTVLSAENGRLTVTFILTEERDVETIRSPRSTLTLYTLYYVGEMRVIHESIIHIECRYP